ncbi:hypothetical protein EXIGLDRAFT_763473 [Exidia glandulosa HHB12029]|uniref:Uncharacterized protein n=1 Tax=Exidia glandulosa HHB12029 TaxID=1314781 RepID=A0A165LXM5_EXIGL|nr:hypothetical protein EXIGLDRAFT_763473 [Exidia glandulosa HHB12029]
MAFSPTTDPLYDRAGAAESIHTLMTTAISETSNTSLLHPQTFIQLLKAEKLRAEVKEIGTPCLPRLVAAGTNDEILVTVIGVLDHCSLLPAAAAGLSKARFLTQSVTINGLGDPIFNKDVDALFMIYQFMDRHFASGRLAAWERRGNGTVHVSSRVLTDSRYAGDSQAEEIPSALDPRGVLQKLADQSGLRYLEDNVVEYSELYQDKLQPALPVVFRPGDIVQATIAFALYPSGKGTYSFQPVLRLLHFLDGDFTDDARLRATTQKIQTPSSSAASSSSPPVLKRRRMFPTQTSAPVPDSAAASVTSPPSPPHVPTDPGSVTPMTAFSSQVQEMHLG